MLLSNASCQITYQVPDQCRWMRESHPQFPIRAWPRVVRCWGRRGPCTLPQGVSWYGRVPHLLVSPGQWGPDIRDATGNKWIGSFGIALGCWFDSQWHMAHMEEHLKNYETPRNMVFVCFCVQRVTKVCHGISFGSWNLSQMVEQRLPTLLLNGRCYTPRQQPNGSDATHCFGFTLDHPKKKGKKS